MKFNSFVYSIFDGCESNCLYVCLVRVMVWVGDLVVVVVVVRARVCVCFRIRVGNPNPKSNPNPIS